VLRVRAAVERQLLALHEKRIEALEKERGSTANRRDAVLLAQIATELVEPGVGNDTGMLPSGAIAVRGAAFPRGATRTASRESWRANR
jgi:hypothetical protein